MDAGFDPGSWLGAVETLLSGAGAQGPLRSHGVDRNTVRLIARIEAQHADSAGRSHLTHAQVAELAGMSKATVMHSRLVLTDAALLELVPLPSQPHGAQRILHLPTAPARVGD